MFDLKNTSTQNKTAVMPLLEVPDTVYLTLSTGRHELKGATVRAEDALGAKLGGGYINAVRVRNGDRHVSVRLIIQGLTYTGSCNWDSTRFCKITIGNPNLEVLL